jgi:hypothetical protein
VYRAEDAREFPFAAGTLDMVVGLLANNRMLVFDELKLAELVGIDLSSHLEKRQVIEAR